MVCPESIQPINIKKKVTDLEQWYLSPLQSTPLGTSTLIPAFLPLFKTIWKILFRNRHQLPRCVLQSRLRSEISSLSMAVSVSRKARSCREPNLVCRGADRPGWYDALPQKRTCTSSVEWAGAFSWWRWSARSVNVNATVTQYTNSVNGFSLPTD